MEPETAVRAAPEARSAGIFWRRMDRAGHESALVAPSNGGWSLEGAAVFAHESGSCALGYRIACDSGWRTRALDVTGWIGTERVRVEVRAESGSWTRNGEPVPDVHGAVDVDLNFSPSTNLLPIRRLGLAVGEAAEVRAAWLRFPSLALEPLEQTYRRLADKRYRYESAGGSFVRELDVDASGFVTRYPGFWEAEA